MYKEVKRICDLMWQMDMRNSDIQKVKSALERQTTHKIDTKKFYGGALCPFCGELFVKYMDNWKSPYCQYCGVKLDWSEE